MTKSLGQFADQVMKEYRESEHGQVVRTYKISSATEADVVYNINKYKDGSYDCECIAYQMGKGKECKHVRAIKTMELKLNEMEVRFKGRLPIGKSLDWGQDHNFKIKGQLIEMTHHDNQDGSYDRRYVLEINAIEIIGDEKK